MINIKPGGFKIEVSYPALALFSIILLISGDSGYTLCIISVIIHEAGHLIAMLLCGIKPSGVSVTLFNIQLLESARYAASFKKDVFITFAGALMNFVAFSAFYFIYTELAFVNLAIGIYNLLPAASLDGGQLLYLLLSRFFSHERSGFVVDCVTVLISFVLFFFGIIILFDSPYNFSMLFISLYLVMSVFIRKDKYL